MFADRFGRCHWLMFAVLLAPVYVRPKGIEVDKNDWANNEAKAQSGRFDKMVDKSGKKTNAVPSPSTDATPAFTSVVAAELDNDPLAEDPAPAATELASDSTSTGTAGWFWAVLGTLCVAGGGIAAFSYYWSRTRNASAW